MHRPSELGSCPNLLEDKLPRLKEKKRFQIWDIVIIVHTGGGGVHFSKILPDCPRKKTFSLCGHDWEHM